MHPSPVSKPISTLLSTAATRLVLGAIRGYKVLISPMFTGCCRYHPSCADYMAEAVRRHGALKGVGFGLRRLARCQPFGGHGLDPVP
ncbi:MAG: membrane protein insertion efficiency factor YidD [Vicinamibacterales bacterium]